MGDIQTIGLQDLVDYNNKMRSQIDQQAQSELAKSASIGDAQQEQAPQQVLPNEMGLQSLLSNQGFSSMLNKTPLGSMTGGASGSAGTASGSAAGGSAGGAASGAGSALGAIGPWAALAAFGVAQDQWAKKKGLRDGEKFRGEYALTGRSPFKDAPYYAKKADKVVPGMGDEIMLASAFSSPVDVLNGKGLKRAKDAIKGGGTVGKLLKKVF